MITIAHYVQTASPCLLVICPVVKSYPSFLLFGGEELPHSQQLMECPRATGEEKNDGKALKRCRRKRTRAIAILVLRLVLRCACVCEAEIFLTQGCVPSQAKDLTERVGIEPTVPLPGQQFSRPTRGIFLEKDNPAYTPESREETTE